MLVPPPERAHTRRTLFRHLAGFYARRKLRARFEGVFVSGLDLARAACARGPVIFVSNHVAWWDTFVLLAIEDALAVEGHALMSTEGLARVPFFRHLGAIAIDRSSAARARSGLQAATALLSAPGRAVVVFAQGEQRPAHVRPLGFERGFELLGRLSGAAVVPMSLSYGFREAPEPGVFVRFGAPLGARASTETAEAAVVDGLTHIDAALVDDFTARVPTGFVPIVTGKNATPEGGLGARLLRGRAD